MIRKLNLYVALLAMAPVALVGCGGGGGAGGAAAATYDTPQAVFDAAKAASEKNDYKTVVGLMTSDTVDNMAAGMVMVGAMIKGFGEMEGADEKGKKAAATVSKVFEKHGLTEDMMKEKEGEEPPENPEDAKAEMLKMVKDRAGFAADMLAAMAESEGEAMLTADAKLTDVKIDGDKATGKISMTKDGEEDSKPIEFRKEGGGWKIHIDEGM